VQKSHKARLEARSFETKQQPQGLGKTDTFASVANMPHLGKSSIAADKPQRHSFPGKGSCDAGAVNHRWVRPDCSAGLVRSIIGSGGQRLGRPSPCKLQHCFTFGLSVAPRPTTPRISVEASG
jgi:hypothetical protein